MSIELVDLELTAPDVVPGDRERARSIVRLRGTPLGTIAGTAAEDALARLGGRAWNALALGEDEDRPGAEPPITVVVCTRDRADRLDGCLQALSRLRYPSYEVLVVDNASSDGATRQAAERWSVRYVREPRPGLDWARNRGLAESHTPIVAYTDDDARPEPGWLAGVAAGFASPDVLAVTGLVLPLELDTESQVVFEDVYGGMGKGFELRLFSLRGRPKRFEPERYGTGCNMAFRRDALVRLGGFDPSLDVGTATGGGGDLDAFQRVIEADGALVYRPDAVVRHIHRRSFVGLRRQLFDNGRGYSAVLFTALLRAKGSDRLRVASRYWRWIVQWHLARLARRALGRERLPFRLLLAELAGAPLGPVVYLRARLAARALARSAPEAR